CFPAGSVFEASIMEEGDLLVDRPDGFGEHLAFDLQDIGAGGREPALIVAAVPGDAERAAHLFAERELPYRHERAPLVARDGAEDVEAGAAVEGERVAAARRRLRPG